MKINPFLFAALLTPAVSVAWADINLGRPAPAEGNVPRQHGIYHSDLMASNTVRAIFKGLRTIPVVDLAMPSPGTQEVAVFQVKENIKHLRYDRMGDEAMNPGKLFPVSLATDVPGQDANLGNKIRNLKPGDEALLCIDHIYLYRDSGNESVHAVTRFRARPNSTGATPPANEQQSAPPVQKNTEPQSVPVAPLTPASPAAPDATPAAPDAAAAPDATTPVAPAPIASAVQPPAPLTPRSGNYARSVESRFSIEPDGKGGYRRTQVEIIREWDQDTGKESVRKYINGTEVDPNTDKPLAPAAPAAPAAPTTPAAS